MENCQTCNVESSFILSHGVCFNCHYKGDRLARPNRYKFIDALSHFKEEIYKTVKELCEFKGHTSTPTNRCKCVNDYFDSLIVLDSSIKGIVIKEENAATE